MMKAYHTSKNCILVYIIDIRGSSSSSLYKERTMSTKDYSKVFNVPRPYGRHLLEELDDTVREHCPNNLPLFMDADYFVYRIAFSLQERRYMLVEDEDVIYDTTSKRELATAMAEKPHLTMEDVEIVDTVCDPSFIPEKCANIVEDMCLTAMSHNYTIVLGNDKPTFRDEMSVFVPYKEGRSERPTLYQEVRDHFINNMGAKQAKGIEADDAVGQVGWNNIGKVIICSVDKDLLTIPGWHLNPCRLDDGVYWVSPKQSCFEFYKSLLTGDATDNIKGLQGKKGVQAGIGAKNKIVKQLEQCTTELAMLNICAETYRTHPILDTMEWYQGVDWKDALVVNANLLFLRSNPYKCKWGLLCGDSSPD
jgi:hypothetical protein